MDPSSGCQIITCSPQLSHVLSISWGFTEHLWEMGSPHSPCPVPSPTSLCEGLGHWGKKIELIGAGGGVVIKLGYMSHKFVMT